MIRPPTMVPLLVLHLIIGTALSAAAQTPSPRIYVLDQEARSVTALDAASGEVIRRAALEGSPSILVRTPDGRRLIALDRGIGRDAGDAGFQAKTQSAATILDADSLTVRARVPLGWGLEPTPMVSRDGNRLSVICTGYVSRRPGESRPREVVTVNLASGEVTARVPLARPASAFFGTPDGRIAVILSARDKPKQQPTLPAELQLIDLVAGQALASTSFEGNPQSPVLSPDGRFVYLLDRGNPSGNPDRNINGRLHIVAVDGKSAPAVVDVGSEPRGFVLDESRQQMLLLSDQPPVKGASNRDRPGQLRAIRSGTVVGPVDLPHGPRVIRAAGAASRIYITTAQGTLAYDPQTLKETGTARTPGLGGVVAITPDGRRAFTTANQNLWTYDLESGKELNKVITGRMGTRLLMAAIAGTATIASESSGRREAERKGRSHYYYTEYNLRDANESMAVRPDSRAVYVLNEQTNDVTIIDAETGNTLEKVGGGGFAVRFLPKAGVALVIDSDAVRSIDLETHQKRDDLHTATVAVFANAEVSPDGRFAVAWGRATVLCVNGTMPGARAAAQTFTRVADVVFAW